MSLGLPKGHTLEYKENFKRKHRKGKYKYLNNEPHNSNLLPRKTSKAFVQLSEAQYAEVLGLVQTRMDYREINKQFKINGSFNFFYDLGTDALEQYTEWFKKYNIKNNKN